MPSSSTGRGKPDTRRTLISRRDTLSERERVEKSQAICARAAGVIEGRCGAGSLVAIYAAKGSEVQTVELDRALRAGGLRVAYPRVVDGSRVLAFCEVAIEELRATRWGLHEPASDVELVVIEEVAAFVVPGVAFDRAGGRLGWGKGHYDATLALARANALSMGLAFECQLVESVPRESHDVVLDMITTEAATYVVV